MMVGSSSAKEEDGEFERKKANGGVIPIHLRDSFFLTHSRDAWENIVRGASRRHPPPPHVAHTANDKGDPGPLVRWHGSNRR
jgi:hypothetical protein